MIKNEFYKFNGDNYQFFPSIKTFKKGFEPDLMECSEKIFELINNPNLLKHLLLCHKEFIQSEFNIENHINNLMDIVYK